MKDNIVVIKCPVCGQEYLPSEIFYPDDLIGHPTEIVKTTSGKVDFFLGQDVNYDEEYMCDNCGSLLNVHANVSYTVDYKDNKFTEEYISKFTKPKKIVLEETDLFND